MSGMRSYGLATRIWCSPWLRRRASSCLPGPGSPGTGADAARRADLVAEPGPISPTPISYEGPHEHERRTGYSRRRGRGGLRSGGTRGRRGRIYGYRAHRAPHAVPRPQERAEAGAPERPRPRDGDDVERRPRTPRRGIRGPRGRARARGARPGALGRRTRRNAPRRRASGRPAPPDLPDPPPRRGCVSGPRLRDSRRPRGRDRGVQLRQARVSVDALEPLAARHVLHRRRCRPANGDVAVADPPARVARPSRLHGLDRARVPARRDHADALSDLPPVRRSRRRPRNHALRSQGNASPRDARALRRRPARPIPHAFLPVHGTVDRAGRVLRRLRRRGLSHVQVQRLDRARRRGHGRPARLRERRCGSRGMERLRVRLRSRAVRAAPVRHRRDPPALVPGSPRAEAVLRVPVSWLRDYVAIDMPLPELAERLSIASAEVEGIERRGVTELDGNLGYFRVGRVLQAGQHPNAHPLHLCHVDVGRGEPPQLACGAWNFGPGATVAVALPGAVLATGMKLEPTKLRGELSNGMILAEDEVALGPDHGGSMGRAGERGAGAAVRGALPPAPGTL